MSGEAVTQAEKNLAVELALLALLALLWGSSYMLIKVALASIPPVTLIAIRASIAMLFLLAVLHLRRQRLPRDGQTWRQLFVQSVFISIASWLLLAWGQQYVDSGLASVLNSTSPIFVFFLTLLVTRHEPVGGWRLLGASLGVGGVVLIVGVDVLRGLGDQVLAQGAVLLGAGFYGCSAIYGKRFAHLGPTVTAAGALIWATAVIVPLSLALDQPWTLRPTALSLLAAVVLAVFCTGTALLLYFRLVHTLGSMGVASQGYLRAGVGVMLGVVVLGEKITPAVGLGLALVILGVAAINLRVSRPGSSPPRP